MTETLQESSIETCQPESLLPDITYVESLNEADLLISEADFLQPYGSYVPPQRLDARTARSSEYHVGEPIHPADLMAAIHRKIQESDWRYRPEYSNKPSQAWRIQSTKDIDLDVFNYSETHVPQDVIKYIARALAHVESHFPSVISKDALQTVIISDHFPPSYHGNAAQFPVFGEAHPDSRHIELSPRALTTERYRMGRAPIPTVSGVVANLATYSLMPELLKAWSEAGYAMVTNVSTNNGASYMIQVPNRPDEIVSDLAATSLWADIAESAVAYVYDGKYPPHQKLSAGKKAIFAQFDQSAKRSLKAPRIYVRSTNVPRPPDSLAVCISPDVHEAAIRGSQLRR